MLWTPASRLVQVALSLLFSGTLARTALVERATTCNGHSEVRLLGRNLPRL
jgi:hypothetical protein